MMSIFWIASVFAFLCLSSTAKARNLLGVSHLKSVTAKNPQYLKESDLRGKVVILDFWATWCESCRKNLILMNDFLKVPKNQSHAKFVFVSMDEEGPDAIRSFFALSEIKASITQIKPRTYWDKSQSLGNRLAKNGIPYLIAFNQKGKVIFEHDGILSNSDLTRLIGRIANAEEK